MFVQALPNFVQTPLLILSPLTLLVGKYCVASSVSFTGTPLSDTIYTEIEVGEVFARFWSEFQRWRGSFVTLSFADNLHPPRGSDRRRYPEACDVIEGVCPRRELVVRPGPPIQRTNRNTLHVAMLIDAGAGEQREDLGSCMRRTLSSLRHNGLFV